MKPFAALLELLTVSGFSLSLSLVDSHPIDLLPALLPKEVGSTSAGPAGLWSHPLGPVLWFVTLALSEQLYQVLYTERRLYAWPLHSFFIQVFIDLDPESVR